MPTTRDGEENGKWGGRQDHFQPNWLHVLLAGLLGSSCCLLQLMINLLTAMNIFTGIGCAGFNKTLGPWRPQLRSAMGMWMVTCWVFAVLRRLPKQKLLVQTVVFAIVTFLPELLLLSGGPALAPPTENVEVLHFKVDGMGCEACQAHVAGVIEQWGGVVATAVDFETGKAEVRIAKNWAEGLPGTFNAKEVAQKLEADGYFMEEEL